MANRIPVVNLDHSKRQVKVDGKEVHLTPKEYELLRLLVDAGGCAIGRNVIMQALWREHYDGGVQSATIGQHISRLRSKIGRRTIKTVTNFGFRLVQA